MARNRSEIRSGRAAQVAQQPLRERISPRGIDGHKPAKYFHLLHLQWAAALPATAGNRPAASPMLRCIWKNPATPQPRLSVSAICPPANHRREIQRSKFAAWAPTNRHPTTNGKGGRQSRSQPAAATRCNTMQLKIEKKALAYARPPTRPALQGAWPGAPRCNRNVTENPQITAPGCRRWQAVGSPSFAPKRRRIVPAPVLSICWASFVQKALPPSGAQESTKSHNSA